ncbi:MAG: peptide ABC transporter substrate-binding protein [Chloroflexota bacterium]|nr:MAG: peptide ABC transporter substrate-binding protein [Chloroflexota bacterium]
MGHLPTLPPSTPPPSNLPTFQPSPSPQPGGAAILGLVGQPDTLNPITTNNTALRELAPLLFDTLLHVDPTTAQLQPGLAESWEYSRDGKRVTFHLPAKLVWSDGRPLTAAAIAASLKATEHPALLAFSEITAPNPEILELTFAAIDCAAVTTLAQLPLLPAAEVLDATPKGSGPFKIAAWSENKRTLTLERNPHYRGPAPLLDGLTVRFIQDGEAAIALSEGQFDAVGPIESKIPLPQPQIFTDLAYPAPQMTYLAINFAPKNVDPVEPQVRQALLLALDREAILAEALDGEGQLLAGPLLPGHWAANADLAWPAYDPDAARTLLTRAGLKDEDGDGWLDQDGRRLELSIRVNGENPLHQGLGWLAASYYRDLGLFARSDSIAFTGLVDDLFTHDFSLAIFSWPLLPDPDQRLFWRSNENEVGRGLNFISYDNPALDRLLDRAVAVPGCAAQDRARIYANIQKTLAAERPVDFLLAPNRHILVGDRLQGVNPGPFVPFTWNAVEWYLTK